MMSEKTPTPPRLAQWLLTHFIQRDIRYAALGDFEEQFHFILQKHSLFRAKAWYWRQALFSMPAFLYNSF